MHNKPSALYIGLMSGTSLDGVDAALVDFSRATPQIVSAHTTPLPKDIKAQLLALNHPGENELHKAALARNALMRLYANAVHALLQKSGLAASAIRAIGAHGQTVRHCPQQFDGIGYTLQLCNPSLLAELTGVDVVADFRNRDIAAGGQGAPLAPFFHHAWFAQDAATVGVLNIGGISNLSVLCSDGRILGFDCGPGNALMDEWAARHTGQSFDADGAWAASGALIAPLAERMLADPYFAQSAPKSTGRDTFNIAWLDRHLIGLPQHAPQDVQRTLLELTARACADDVQRYALHGAAKITTLFVCGGGAFNTALMQRLQALLPQVLVTSSAARQLPPQLVEAVAFAWLARQHIEQIPLPLHSVTGARGARILGGLYPA